ncbi:radical SAM family heme chaperone HemW [Stieleria varia]|uniref:Heme chaperone HemW n=1 Tax=Stieleria varia TaxID=2528005 RepID=A0A5C6AWX6_9BACT|nr:radical SAM family heme chaperone HemW [Stieleria varia]TWU04515.1 Oxygen-independent coproporphyrinogen-III oxidase-like protein [Stieleria varia]
MTSGQPQPWPIPRSAYIHVPFCRHRCGYCNFSVVADRDDLITRFLDAIDNELSILDRPSIDTLFLGGGTPTHLPIDALQELMRILHRRFRFSEDIEFSSEANPEDITEEKLCVLADAGVNRISLGVQSFDDQKLSTLQRGHSGDSAQRIIEQVTEVIANVSIDLIFAAPGESLETWQRDVATALALPIQHLSTYALTFEKGTLFWNQLQRGDLQPAGESLELEMYELVRSVAPAAGMTHYEISSFATPTHRCRHNIAYWEGSGWYAAGPGAARFVNGRREVNHRSTTAYLRRMETGQSPTAESELVTPQQAARERAAFGIRRIDGIDLADLAQQTGVNMLTLLADAIEQCEREDLIVRNGDHIRLTERGILFADTVASRFLA